MKIGIVTFTSGNNYGQRLQNYAMQEVCKNYGDEVLTIKHKERRKSIKGTIKKCFHIFNVKSFLWDVKRNKAFQNFDKEYVQYYDKKLNIKNDNQDINNDFDYFVAGSDQVWSPNSPDVDKNYFLDFASNEKKVSYAPSIASETIPENKLNEYVNYWKTFSCISIRENNFQDIIARLTGKDVYVHIDPTMLLDRTDWHKMTRKPKDLTDDNYAVFYFLGAESENVAKVKEFCKEQNLKIIDLFDKEQLSGIGPQEFLYLIENAQLMVTDSFHGCVFSILFHTPFVVMERKSSRYSMNSRFDTLLTTFHLENRMISKIDFNNVFEMDFDKTENVLSKKREESKEYLDRCFK